MLHDITHQFTALFGVRRSSNPARKRIRLIAEPGLNVVLHKEEFGFSLHSGCGPQKQLQLGTELTFRTQSRDETQAAASARKQLRRRHPRERGSNWRVQAVSSESKVAREP